MKPIPEPRMTASEVESYAVQYDIPYDAKVEQLVADVQQRGRLTKAELALVGEWKSPRIRPRLAQNSEELIREVTRIALETRSVSVAVHVLQALAGVGMPVASTILHWFHRDPFPILDWRAAWSMGFEPQAYSLVFWESYVETARSLSSSWGVDMRTLDRALWKFSEVNQPRELGDQGARSQPIEKQAASRR